MATTKTKLPVKDLTHARDMLNPEKIQEEAVTVASPLLKRATALGVVDNASYMIADSIRGQIKPIRKTLWDRVTALVKPAKESYDGLIAFRHEVVDALDKADKIITDKMQEYKRLEYQEMRRAELHAANEAARLTREAEDKARAAEAARTKPMQTRLENQALKLAEQAVEVAEVKFEAVQGDASTTRTVTKWRVTDKNALLAAVIAGEVPEDVVEIDPVAMGKYFRFNREDFKSFPGVEIYDDVEIASKRGRG